MTETVAPQGMRWLRYTVLALAGLEVALFLWIELDFLLRSPGMDMLTRSMNRDFSLIAIVPFALFTLPALILAIMRRWLVVRPGSGHRADPADRRRVRLLRDQVSAACRGLASHRLRHAAILRPRACARIRTLVPKSSNEQQA